MTFSQTYFSGQNLQSYRPDDPHAAARRPPGRGPMPHFIMIKINGNIVETNVSGRISYLIKSDGPPVAS